jgi:hypothetical protein
MEKSTDTLVKDEWVKSQLYLYRRKVYFSYYCWKDNFDKVIFFLKKHNHSGDTCDPI